MSQSTVDMPSAARDVRDVPRRGVNVPAIAVLVVLHQIIGGTWYALFADPWMVAVRRSAAEFEGGSPVPYVLAIVAAIVVNYFLARLLPLVGVKSFLDGAGWGALLWLCLVFPYATVHNAFSLNSFVLTLIDSGKELVGLVVSGAVLGGWKKRAR